MVAALKRLGLAATHWSPEDRAWRTPGYNREQVVGMFRRHGYSVEFHGDDADREPVDPGEAFLASLPAHLRPITYRAVVRVLHPDVGGDLEACKRWTVAGGRVLSS